MKELGPKFQELYKTADEVGGKASAEGVKLPKEVFDKFHPGPRKDPKKIEKKNEKKEKK